MLYWLLFDDVLVGWSIDLEVKLDWFSLSFWSCIHKVVYFDNIPGRLGLWDLGRHASADLICLYRDLLLSYCQLFFRLRKSTLDRFISRDQRLVGLSGRL